MIHSAWSQGTKSRITDTTLRSQLFRVIDVETTGLDPAIDRVVEFGWAIVSGDGTVENRNSTLVNPGRPIPANASRVHRIFDSDVADAPAFDEALAAFPEFWEEDLPFVFHNAAFDSQFMRPSPRFAASTQILCTMRLAQNLIPQLGSYSLNHLRTQLGIVETAPAHRAAADVATTCALLTHLIDRYLDAGHKDSLEGLTNLSKIRRMPFGKHKGQLLTDVPRDYMDWLLGRDIDDELRDALIEAKRGAVRSSSRLRTADPRSQTKRRWWWPF